MHEAEAGGAGTENASSADLPVWRGPTLMVRIGFDPNYLGAEGTCPQLGTAVFPALIDTGSMTCCIDSALAAALQLPVIDRTRIAGVQGAFEVDVHPAQMFMPDLEFTMVGPFTGVHLQAGGQQHQALIGRDFLRHHLLIYDGHSGSVRVSRAAPNS